MITFNCPGCGKKFAVPEEHAGRKARCPGCKGTITIPSPAGAAPQRPRQQPAASRQPAPAQEARQSSPADVANALKTRMAAPPRHVARGGLWIDKRMVLGLLGSGILIAGVFAPVFTGSFGTRSYFDHSLFAGGAIIGMAAASIVFTLITRYRTLLATGILALGSLGYVFVDYLVRTYAGSMKDVSVAWGWAVLVLGAIILLVTSALKD